MITPCVFCDVARDSSSEEFRHVLTQAGESELSGRSQILAEASELLVIPDVAPIALGHTLIVPKAHIEAVAQLVVETRRLAVELAEHLALWLRTVGLASDTLIFEHGTGSTAHEGWTDGKCGHTKHAHVHVVPLNGEVPNIEALAGFDGLFAEALPDTVLLDPSTLISADRHYLWWRTNGTGTVYIADTEVPSQWVRRSLIGCQSVGGRDALRGDWRDYSSLDAPLAGREVASLVRESGTLLDLLAAECS